MLVRMNPFIRAKEPIRDHGAGTSRFVPMPAINRDARRADLNRISPTPVLAPPRIGVTACGAVELNGLPQFAHGATDVA